jgi:hypothetical protein
VTFTRQWLYPFCTDSTCSFPYNATYSTESVTIPFIRPLGLSHVHDKKYAFQKLSMSCMQRKFPELWGRSTSHMYTCTHVCAGHFCAQKQWLTPYTDKQLNNQVFWVCYGKQKGYWYDAALKNKDFKTAFSTTWQLPNFSLLQNYSVRNFRNVMSTERLFSPEGWIVCCIVNRSWKFFILLHHNLNCSTLLRAIKLIWCDLQIGLK